MFVRAGEPAEVFLTARDPVEAFIGRQEATTHQTGESNVCPALMENLFYPVQALLAGVRRASGSLGRPALRCSIEITGKSDPHSQN